MRVTSLAGILVVLTHPPLPHQGGHRGSVYRLVAARPIPVLAPTTRPRGRTPLPHAPLPAPGRGRVPSLPPSLARPDLPPLHPPGHLPLAGPLRGPVVRSGRRPLPQVPPRSGAPQGRHRHVELLRRPPP